MKMDRQDSGYSDTIHASPRTSTSSRRSSPSKDTRSSNPPTNPKPKRRTTNSSSHSSTKSSTRPSTKRASRSSPFPTSTLMQTRNSVSGSSRRPSMAARGHTHSASTPYHSSSQTYQFFHFPTFDPIASSHPPSGQAQEEMSELEVDTPRHHPPPATTQYWTSDSTRRLEYAAIDAAGKGVKGFLIRCVPDCILPVEKRRTRFCGENGIDEDCGSVRRYRLTLPEEKSLVEQCREQRPGFLRRWTTFGRRRDSC
ncbi:hypothetical protein B0J14DRAFT_473623 [Halenospora varia]|nr:hypothetical protein B0J14DRAFT_473623 [Halenospora varia]